MPPDALPRIYGQPERNVLFFEIPGETIWGATARITAALTASEMGSTSRRQVGIVASTHSERLHALPAPVLAKLVTWSSHSPATITTWSTSFAVDR